MNPPDPLPPSAHLDDGSHPLRPGNPGSPLLSRFQTGCGKLKAMSLGIIAVFLAISLPLIGGEIAMRIYLYARYGTTDNGIGYLTLDDRLGWRPTKNFTFHSQKSDIAGHEYSVEINTNKYGFRSFGNLLGTDKKKVFFIGDSFTHAVEVSDSQTFYGLLKNALPIEVFAYGGGGYGTLQEY